MRPRSRLAAWSLVTAAAYLSAALWCAAPAPAQQVPSSGGRGEEPEQTPGAMRPGRDPLVPAAPPDSGGVLVDEVLDPAQFIVGPGDLFALTFWGAQNFNHRLRVDAQGRLFIPNVGFVAVAGKTLAAADSLVGQRVRASYPRLKNGLILLTPRRFLVHVTGLVKRPDSYVVTPLTRVSSALVEAGGRLPGGSQRTIEVRRGGKVVLADLQPFYHGGDRSKNPFLVEGDVVFVPAAKRDVALEGAVHRPGRYELLGDGSIAELLALAGGLHPDASATLAVRVIRRTRDDQIEHLLLGPVRSAAVARTVLQRGDRVVIPGLHEAQRTVLVQGAIAGAREFLAAAGPDKRMDNAGSTAREATLAIPFYDGDTVRVVLERAGGLLPWADARNAVLERRDAAGKSTRVSVDAYALLVLRDVTRDVPVQAGDVVYVPAERDSVMVAGPVHRPGLYQYNPRYTALDYVNLAGGPTQQGKVAGSKVIGKSGAQVGIDQARTVTPGDTIAVKQKALTTFEWVQVLVAVTTLLLSAATITVTLKSAGVW